MAETGSQAWLYGGLNSDDTNGVFASQLTPGSQIVTYPTANYQIDGSPGEPLAKNAVYRGPCLFSRCIAYSQEPFVDSTGRITYFQTPTLAAGTHKIDVVVTSANADNQFIFDYFAIFQGGSISAPTPIATLSGPPAITLSSRLPTVTSSSHPTATSSGFFNVTSTGPPAGTSTFPVAARLSSNSVGTIVGGVVGGVAGVIVLAVALWSFLMGRCSGRRDLEDSLRDEDSLSDEGSLRSGGSYTFH